ncbi:MAG: ferrous iron transport protein B [Planctomycetota bacterium]|jgi:ferrous iron transport protein B
MRKSHLTIALAGNPNSGKTSIFNAITGSRQHVGNYPGVTVEKKEGSATFQGTELRVVDLPGTYSLTAYSIEEIIARNFVMDKDVDVVIDIIDSSNLERNLYLATQLLELDVPLVLAFNMSDVAEARGYNIDDKILSELLGVPIVHTVGHKEKGIENLLAAAVNVGKDKTQAIANQRHVDYGHEIEPHIQELSDAISDASQNEHKKRWYAIKLLEEDKVAIGRLKEIANHQIDNILQQTQKLRQHIEGICGDRPEIVLADRRYGFISGACTEAVTQSVEARHALSDQIDILLTNRVLGLPIFIVLMYLVFQLTFTVADPPMQWIEQGFGWLANQLAGWWPKASDSILKSLLVDGIIGGVGGVIVFLPNILFLFLAIALLEDSGYMARAAFIMDRLMHKIGLHGKSSIPMLIGFGCSVPAIMATRTLESHRDRLTTILVLPLMSCSARLPIYALIIPAFFPQQWRGPMLWFIYLIGILLAIVCAKILRSTLLQGENTPFVMELPPYRLPTVKGLIIHMWDRSWLYLKKAGTIILGLSIIMWALTSFPRKTNFDQAKQAEIASYTIAGRIGHAIEPILRPMGFDWRIGTALIGAMAAKEVFVAQMGIVYATGQTAEQSTTLREHLSENYTPLTGFCIMLFCLISAPCMATITVTGRETNSWKWAIFQFAGLTIIAYMLTVLVFQVGQLIS